jgi:hypothetical protein
MGSKLKMPKQKSQLSTYQCANGNPDGGSDTAGAVDSNLHPGSMMIDDHGLM